MSRIFRSCIFDLPVFSCLAFSVAPFWPCSPYIQNVWFEANATSDQRLPPRQHSTAARLVIRPTHFQLSVEGWVFSECLVINQLVSRFLVLYKTLMYACVMYGISLHRWTATMYSNVLTPALSWHVSDEKSRLQHSTLRVCSDLVVKFELGVGNL